MKGALLGLYFGITFICSIFYWLFGEHSYRGYFYNLGQSIVWPVILFKNYPEIDGSSDESFARTFIQVERSGSSYGYYLYNESLWILAYYHYADSNPAITMNDYESLNVGSSNARDFLASLVNNGQIRKKLAEDLDGMTFGDIIDNRDDFEDELIDLIEDR